MTQFFHCGCSDKFIDLAAVSYWKGILANLINIPFIKINSLLNGIVLVRQR